MSDNKLQQPQQPQQPQQQQQQQNLLPQQNPIQQPHVEPIQNDFLLQIQNQFAQQAYSQQQIISGLSELKRSVTFNKKDWTDKSLEKQAKHLEAISLVQEQQPTGLSNFLLALLRSVSKLDDGVEENSVETSLEKEIREYITKELAEQVLSTLRVSKNKDKTKRKSQDKIDDICSHCKSSNHDESNCWLKYPDKAPLSWFEKRMRKNPMFNSYQMTTPQYYPPPTYPPSPQPIQHNTSRPKAPPSCGNCGRIGHTDQTCYSRRS